jgi:hypothetical protein
MADHNLPTTASTYGNYTSQLDGRLKDLAFQNDPAVTTVANPPANMVRFNSAQNRWEKYTGTVWNVLASTYAVNVATANALATGRTAALTGDASGTSAAWTGSGNLSIPLTLNTVNSNVGAFGSSAAVPVITVNAKGLITAVSTAALGSIATQSSASVAITGGAISATTITLKQSTTAAPTGEGVVEWDTDNDQLKVGTGTATKTMVDTDSTQTLTSKTLGTGSNWGGNAVPVANGGTGATTAAAARTNLGVSSMGTQASTAVSITGGAISGTAITLVQSTSAAPTAEGRIEWDTDNDLLVLGTAAGTKVMVDTNSTQTLTNKTITGAFTGNIAGNATTATNANSANAKWTSAQLAGSTSTSDQVSARIQNAGGTGDGNVAALGFVAQGSYGIHMHLRHDGYFGIGGYSRAAWSWYSDPSGNMVAAGNVTAYSDPRLKENFERVQDPMAILNQLDGGTFNWKHGFQHTAVKAGKRDYGVLADQVEAVMPEIVTESISIDGEQYKTVAYEKLVPVLIEAIKGLSAQVEELKAKVA